MRAASTVRAAPTAQAPKTFDLAQSGLRLKPLSPGIGVEISGVDLSVPLSDQHKEAIYQVLLDYKVVFFRDQDITTAQHVAFTRCFGDLEVHPFAPKKEGFDEVLLIEHNRESRGRENIWHSDVTWRQEPSLGSILRAVEVPEIGGDTLFSDMNAAYDGLDDAMKARLEGLVAMHDFAPFRERLKKRGASAEEIAEFNKKFPKAYHPVVRTHPDTGRKGIYVNRAFTQTIEGMEAAEADALLRELYRQAAVPEYQCRFRWTKNAIAFWDNRAAQHYAVSDYWPNRRIMERVTIKGDKPFNR